jgi:DNA-binding response OmpR family regulator
VHLNKADGTVPLLHIDDSAEERLLVREAISLTKTPFTFYEADGIGAASPYFQFDPQRFPRPGAVLLDYDLGNHTGVDLLYWLRIKKKISAIPVVMLSGSVGTPHVAECYEMGANYFLSKPNDLAHLKTLVRMLHLTLVTGLPRPLQLLNEYQPDPRKVGIPLLV